MKKLIVAAAMLLCLLPLPAYAHRLDEYLQATILSIDSSRVDGSMRLVPGVAVSSGVIGSIDTNGDGLFSPEEQQAYAQLVVHDLLLKVDQRPLSIRLESAAFPSEDQIRQGTGEIELHFTADLPRVQVHRTLLFENHHRQTIAVYLVNCLIPEDKNIHLGEQVRNVTQSSYQLSFEQGAEVSQTGISTSFSGFAGAFRLGMRHIAEGTDHLLFLLTLLLPAPLFARAGRWGERASVRQSLIKILRIVTAFTLGHSLTLLLSAFGLLHLPSRSVEVLIAVSILVSAFHAMRPIFPGREAAIAAFFGLIHGLAFASAITQLGFDRWYRFVSILAFNLGIETMQLIVIAATLPSLLLLSRTQAFRPFRIGGASLSAIAALGWIVERSFGISTFISASVEALARHAAWLAMILFLASLLCWCGRNRAHTATVGT